MTHDRVQLVKAMLLYYWIVSRERPLTQSKAGHQPGQRIKDIIMAQPGPNLGWAGPCRALG